MSVDSVSLRFSVAAGGLLLPLAGAVAGRCCGALLRPNTIPAARTAETCDTGGEIGNLGGLGASRWLRERRTHAARVVTRRLGAPVAKQLCLGEV